MEYRILRLCFDNGIHIGEGSLEDSSIRLRADTIFSALCIEALKLGGYTMLNQLILFVKAGSLIISDAFPYINDEYFVPKPIRSVRANDSDVDSGAKKVFKQMKYIPIDMVDEYVAGEFDVETVQYITNRLNEKLGESIIVARAAVRVPDDTLPYHVGVYQFRPDAGLYIVVSGTSASLKLLNELFFSLAYSGLGGKRSSGLGRFQMTAEELDDDIAPRINDDYPLYITLSVSLPQENEMEQIIHNSSYMLVRRSGYVFSDTYADDFLRKMDLYMLDSGAVVSQKYLGDLYDVSNEGNHPVYRYGKPLFLGVTL
ncbi:MAG: type III-A CRISPR-associated RAMP protein Csm4 [Oscillospiraceae bacterium]|nr:type III-A CRISPR-associated RAMP protein Csm4 [Oscillospiraceae bacterium]